MAEWSNVSEGRLSYGEHSDTFNLPVTLTLNFGASMFQHSTFGKVDVMEVELAEQSII